MKQKWFYFLICESFSTQMHNFITIQSKYFQRMYRRVLKSMLSGEIAPVNRFVQQNTDAIKHFYPHTFRSTLAHLESSAEHVAPVSHSSARVSCSGRRRVPLDRAEPEQKKTKNNQYYVKLIYWQEYFTVYPCKADLEPAFRLDIITKSASS